MATCSIATVSAKTKYRGSVTAMAVLPVQMTIKAIHRSARIHGIKDNILNGPVFVIGAGS
jgi:hypothetical protein